MADTTKTHGRSTAGVELTDYVLNTMADEAEAGLDVTKIKRRPGRPSMGSGPADTLPVRLDPELRQAVEHCVDAQLATGRHRPGMHHLPIFVGGAHGHHGNGQFFDAGLSRGLRRVPTLRHDS